MIRAFGSRQFAAFLLMGGFAALVNFGSRILYDRWVSFSTAVVLAYVTGMVVAYVLARRLVFGGGVHSVRRSALIFAAVNLAAVAQTWLVSMAMARYALPSLGVQHYVPEIAHAVGIVVPVFTSFLGHKHFSFTRSPAS